MSNNNFHNINSFILNSYIETINEFVGEKIVLPVKEEMAQNLNNDTFNFFYKLAITINAVKSNKRCCRNCLFRKEFRK